MAFSQSILLVFDLFANSSEIIQCACGRTFLYFLETSLKKNLANDNKIIVIKGTYSHDKEQN